MHAYAKTIAALVTVIVCLCVLVEPLLIALNAWVFQAEVTAIKATWTAIKVDYTYSQYPLLTGVASGEVPIWRVLIWIVASLIVITIPVFCVWRWKSSSGVSTDLLT